MTCFADDEVPNAFRYMAKRKNIGKIVVSFAERGPSDGDVAESANPIREDGTYLITGGLGALGMQLARKLSEQGAGAIALMSRRDPSPKATEEIEELRTGGTRVFTLCGDVADPDSVRGALAQITSLPCTCQTSNMLSTGRSKARKDRWRFFTTRAGSSPTVPPTFSESQGAGLPPPLRVKTACFTPLSFRKLNVKYRRFSICWKGMSLNYLELSARFNPVRTAIFITHDLARLPHRLFD